MSWDDVGDAIQAALVRASGLAANRVIWKGQDRNAPTDAYIAISLGGLTTVGIDYLKVSTDLTRSAGQEIAIEVRGVRAVPLEVEAFTPSVAVSGRRNAALELCSRALAGLLLPAVRGLLRKQGVSPYDFGDVQWVPDIPNTTFRGRAYASVRCYMPPPTAIEYCGYIARVTGTTTIQGVGSGFSGSSGGAISLPFSSPP